MERKVACLFCDRVEARYYFTKTRGVERYSIYECSFCSGAFVWPRPKSELIEAMYTDPEYKGRTIDSVGKEEYHYHPTGRMDARLILKRCNKLSQGRRLLDVGAGLGHLSHEAVKKGLSVIALEPNPLSRKAFTSLNGFEPDGSVFDDGYGLNRASSFDMVVVSHVLEHILAPNSFVQNIRRVLDKNGIAAVASPHFGSALSQIQGKNDMFISPPEHLNFFSLKGLEHLFRRHGLKLLFSETTSKVPRQRIERMVKFPILSTLAWVWLYLLLKSFDPFGMGMVINAYFKKV